MSATMDGSVDYENVQIGKWQSSIPSEICISKDVFNEIFSAETWYKVLMPDQRERILQFLPPAVTETVGASQQTVEDLLARTLTRFDSNPLDTFYHQLEQGRYDPSVVQTRKALQKAWKKESIRRRKKYHAKLLQDILVSREKLLERKRSRQTASPVRVLPLPNANRTLARGAPASSNGSDAKTIEKLVEKRYREEISAINRQVGCESSSDDDAPPAKKSAKTPKKPTAKPKTKEKRKTAVPTSTTGANSMLKAVLNEPALSELSLSPQATSARQQSCAKLPTTATSSSTMTNPAPVPRSREEQAAVQMSKFTKILPAPITAVSAIPSPISVQTTTPVTALNPTLVNVNVSLRHPLANQPNVQSSANIGMSSSHGSPNVTSLHFQPSPVVKSSPILASQLQSTNTFATGNQKGTQQQLPKLPFAFPSIQSIKLEGPSTDDDLESSSDDEFEAIEPTIGFGTVPVTSCNVKQNQMKLTSQKLSPCSTSTPLPSRMTQPVVKLESQATPRPKSAQFIRLTPQNLVTPSGQPAFSAVKYSTVQLNKILTSQQSPVQTQQVLQPSQNQQNPQGGQPQAVVPNKINVVKLVTQPGAASGAIFRNLNAKPIIPVISSSSNLNSASVPTSPITMTNVVQTSPSIRAPRPTAAIAVPPNSKILPITVNLQHVNKPVIRPLASLSVTNQGNVIPNVDANGPTSNLINVSISSSSVLSNMLSASTSSTNSITPSGLQMFNLLGNRTMVDSLGDDLNLNLGLGLRNLDDSEVTDDDIAGLDTSKFPKLSDIEKIDDLSVLEGNPFDSIPNLSDELDGLDLDLVDGLCDFEGLLSEEKQHASFFSLIRDVLCSTRDHRMTLVCLEKTVRKWSGNATAALNMWFHRVHDWNDALITALNFLAGMYQDVHPEDFVPYIEYKYKTKYYQWIGAGRDSDNNLTPLCNIWLANADRLPPLKKMDNETEDHEEEDEENEDSDALVGEDTKKKSKRPQTPPPPRFITDWSVRPSSLEEKQTFQAQERMRFENPHKAFTYRMHGYESVVGPVKGVYSNQSGMTNKARGHSLLVDDRPPYVTILALVRDAVARLPNGEGTRSEICEMLRDSAFLAPEASNVTLNSVVSGALDRLHYERDPCVRYDSHKKSWVYLHRDRTQEQFERLHHNRSYTKSTKSRSTTSRKSRKVNKASMSAKDVEDNSPPPSVAAVTTSASAIAASTLGSPVTLSPQVVQATTKLPPVGTIIAKSSLGTTTVASASHGLGSTIRLPLPNEITSQNVKPVMTPINSSQSKPLIIPVTPGGCLDPKQVPKVENTATGTSSLPTIIEKAPVQVPQIRKLQIGEMYSPASSLSSSIRFTTVPSSTVPSNISNVIATNNAGLDSAGSSIIFRASGSTMSGTSSGTAQILTPQIGSTHQGVSNTVTVQVQPIVTSQALPQTISTSGKTLVTQANVSQTGAGNNASLSSNPLLLNPSTLIRLASSIRLPEGVRFAQVRLPVNPNSSQQSSTGQVRLPQQRIILTRAALSSQAQTQGVLLGQTASGQTVILSTTPGGLSHLQTGSSQIPITITSSQAQSFENSSSGAMNSAASMITNMSTPPRTGISLVSSSLQPGTQNLSSSTSFGELSATPSLVVNSSNILSSSGVSTTVQMTQNQSVLASSTSQPIMAQVGNQISHQQPALSAHTGQPGSAQLSSPIIIRSQQGDLLIPHLPIGRGMQGIKVIPIPGGKQTVLARIVAPTQPSSQLAAQNTATHTTTQ